MSQAIDGSFAFDTDPDKQYSIYVPTSYDAGIPQKLMLGLHPLNTSRWNAKAWRDTLVTFAETNNLLLVCPDGGADGRIDDPIDTAFTTILLDSIYQWYNVDQSQKYIMGFSWGGKTTYTYGLRRTDEFAGYLAIGAAVTVSEISSLVTNAKDESFYLVHGTQDNVQTRYSSILEQLELNGACTNSTLMDNVGHTIDFPNRNEILTDAFIWLENSNCLSSTEEEEQDLIANRVYPNPFEDYITIPSLHIYSKISLYSTNGQLQPFTLGDDKINVPNLNPGQYILSLFTEQGIDNHLLLKL